MPSINIKFAESEPNPSTSDYLNKKLAPLMKYLREENSVHVEMDYGKDKSGAKCHVEITINPKSEMFAEARGSDFLEAIDLCIPKIKEQLLKHKDKRIALRKKLGSQRKGR